MVIDPALAVRVLGTRSLGYRDTALPDEDRPPHVRAASGIAVVGGRLAIVQDDASFIAILGPDDPSARSLALPRGRHGRRRFEEALGNKQDKLDLESCLAIAGTLWAFGSGSKAGRDHVARIGKTVELFEVPSLYAALRDAVGSEVNIEGVAIQGSELWMFHRGNTGERDLGPAIVRFPRDELLAAIIAEPHRVPAPHGIDRFDLGAIDGTRLGFTDAVSHRERVYFLAAAERAANAIDDGPALGSYLGVIDGDRVRAAPLAIGGAPIKAEGLAFDPRDATRGWIVVDPDDTEQPAPLIAIELVGPW